MVCWRKIGKRSQTSRQKGNPASCCTEVPQALALRDADMDMDGWNLAFQNHKILKSQTGI